MNEKVLITKKIDSAVLYIPELENYLGKNLSLTISIVSDDDQKKISLLLLQSEDIGLSGIDVDNAGCFEGECSFELT